MALYHVYSQTVADGTATSVVRPSDWNSAHSQVVTLAGNTAGASTLSGTNVIFQGGNNVTLSVNQGANVGTMVVSAANQTAQTQNLHNVTLSGNTAGVMAQISSGTMTLAGGNNITLSQNGNAVTISGPNVSQYLTTARASNDAVGLNTALTANGVSWTVNSSGLSLNVPAFLTTARASNDAVGLNTALTGNGVAWTVNSSGLSLNVPAFLTTARASTDAVGLNTALTANGVSWTVNSSGISMNVPAFLTTAAQSNHSHNFATTTTNGSLIVVGTANSAGATIGVPPFITTAAAAQTTQTQPAGNIAGAGYTSTTQAGSTVGVTQNSNGLSAAWPPFITTFTQPGATVFSNSNNVSFGLNGSTVTATATFSQSAQTANFYVSGNTTQLSSTAGLDLRSLSFEGAGIASVGVSNGRVLVSVPSGGGGGDGYNIVQMGTGTVDGGGTSGATFSTLSGSIYLQAGNNMTLSQTSNTINISGADVKWQLVGVNTAGTTSSNLSANQFYFSGGNNVTLSGNSNTIVVSAAAGGGGGATNTQRMQWPPGNLSVVSALGNGSFSINRMQADAPISATRVDVPFLVSIASSAAANTWGLAVTCFGAVYTKNGSTLSSLSSGSASFSLTLASNTAGSTQVIPHAIRPLSIPMNMNMSVGEYYVGFGVSTNTSSVGTATTALGNTWSVLGGPVYSSAVVQVGDFSATTNTSTGLFGGQGVYSAAISTVPPTVSLSAINQTGSYYARAMMGLIFRNI